MPIRPFGYEADRYTLRDHEADLIRDAATRLADGDSLAAVVRDWTAQGVTTPAGNPWQSAVLGRVLKSDRIAGKRRRADGVLVDADHPPIIDPDLKERLDAQLATRTASSDRISTERTYLLTGGITVCGLCSTPLAARAAVKGRRSYACSSSAPWRGCGKVRIRGELLDDEVGVRVIAKLKQPRTRDRLAKLITAVEQRAEDSDQVVAQAKDRLAELGEQYAGGKITAETMAAATTGLKREISDARKNRAIAKDLESVAAVESVDIVDWWEGASLGQQRTLVGVMIRDVAVMPAPVKGSKTFAPERVKIRWN